MIRRLFPPIITVLVFCTPISWLVGCLSVHAETSTLSLIPADSHLLVKVRNPEAFLNILLHPGLLETLKSTPSYKRAEEAGDLAELWGIVSYLETALGTDWRDCLRQITGKGMTLALVPDNSSFMIIEPRNLQMLQKLNGIITTFANLEALKKGENGIESRTYRGIRGWRLNEENVHAFIGDRLILAKNWETLQGVVDRYSDANSQNMVSSSRYQQAVKHLDSKAPAQVFVDLESLRKQPGIKKQLSGDSNPMLTLFMGDLRQNLRDSEWLAITAKVKNENGLYFQSTFQAPRPGNFDFMVAREKSSAGSPPQLSVPKQIARISLYRDLHDFYIQKDELFPERTSGLIFFENMMGIFFSGRDLADEVLAEIGPGIELVVAEQSYQELENTPDVRLPGFAAVFKLNNPQHFGPVVEEAWQKAIGLVNFTRGQKAEPGLIIDRPQYQNIKYTIAYFSSASDHAARHIRYNLRPALALPDDFMILSSSEELARDLMDSLRKGVAAAESAGSAFHSILELNGLNLLTALSSNRENLIQNNMVEEGNTREKAEEEIDGLLSLATLMKVAKLTTGYRENRTAANLDLEFNMAVVQ